ncbi:MAG: hypothetical protein Fur007_01990 [Rhodoferax sp.]
MAKALPIIDPTRCSGCGACLGACEPRVLALVPQGWRKKAQLIDAPGCTGCALCAKRCWTGAIRMQRQTETQGGSA